MDWWSHLEVSSGKREREDGAASRHGHHLLAVGQIGNWVGGHSATQIDAPQLSSVVRVQREKIGFQFFAAAAEPAAVSAEQEMAGSGEDSRPGLSVRPVFPALSPVWD